MCNILLKSIQVFGRFPGYSHPHIKKELFFVLPKQKTSFLEIKRWLNNKNEHRKLKYVLGGLEGYVFFCFTGDMPKAVETMVR